MEVPVGAFGWKEAIYFLVELEEKVRDLLHSQHAVDNSVVAVTAFFKGSTNFADCSQTHFENITNISLGIAFFEHVGDGKPFAEHDLLGGGEEVFDKIGGDGGGGERGEDGEKHIKDLTGNFGGQIATRNLGHKNSVFNMNNYC